MRGFPRRFVLPSRAHGRPGSVPRQADDTQGSCWRKRARRPLWWPQAGPGSSETALAASAFSGLTGVATDFRIRSPASSDHPLESSLGEMETPTAYHISLLATTVPRESDLLRTPPRTDGPPGRSQRWRASWTALGGWLAVRRWL